VEYTDEKSPLRLTDLDRLEGRGEESLLDMRAAGSGGGEPGAEVRRALRMAFTLRSSKYATMCIRELLKEFMAEATEGAGAPVTAATYPPPPPANAADATQ
jgi:tRNA(Glu) U13 pseudouridine synthase TruD